MKYRCDAGHEIDLENTATWTTLLIRTSTGSHEYSYCPMCFGEAAVKLWPLRVVRNEGEA